MPDKSDLMQALHKGTVNVTFIKTDGSVRHMTCTLAPGLMPDMITEAKVDTSRKSQDENLIRVYDLEAAGWRSFKWDRVQTWHA